MSNVWVKEKVEGRESGYDAEFRRTYTRVFLVLMNSYQDGPVNVRASTGVPRMYDTYATGTEFDTGAFVNDIKAKKDEAAPYLWEVTVTYGSYVRGAGGTAGLSSADPARAKEDPILRPADVKWSFAKYQKPMEKDQFNRPIVNSAGFPFDPPYMQDDNRPLLTVSRNELSFSPLIAWDYKDSINIDAFFGSPAQTVKCSDITADLQWERGLAYWRVTYAFEFRPTETWAFRPMDRGKAYFKTNGQLVVATDDFGATSSDPVPLNGKAGAAGKTKLTAVSTIGQTFLEVVSTASFVSELPFDIQVEFEDMRVTAIPNLTRLVVTPGVNGTTQAGHPNSIPVRQKALFLTYYPYKLKQFSLLNLP